MSVFLLSNLFISISTSLFKQYLFNMLTSNVDYQQCAYIPCLWFWTSPICILILVLCVLFCLFFLICYSLFHWCLVDSYIILYRTFVLTHLSKCWIWQWIEGMPVIDGCIFKKKRSKTGNWYQSRVHVLRSKSKIQPPGKNQTM